MGLLDKAGEIDKKPAKAVPKAKAAPKAKPAPKAKAARPAREKVKRERPARDFPADFVAAGKTNRAAAWVVNFSWNWGVLIAVMSLLIFTGTGDMTWPLVAGLLLPLSNVFIIPAKFGRNIGEFVSRTKYVSWRGEKPIFLHGILTNINTPMMFLGLGFLAVSGIGNTGTGNEIDAKMITLCLLCFAFPLSEYIFKKIVGKESQQGMWDKMFGAYLVHHVPSGKETGWLARLESLGEFGAKRIAKIDEKRAASDADDDS